MRPVSRLALLAAALSLVACSGEVSVVGGDASVPIDLGVQDVGLPEVPSAMDVPLPIDAPDAPDVPPADTGPARCAADPDCVGSPGGPACDVASGRCVTCTPASDRCPAGQYCVGATNTCAAGCRDDLSCGGGGADGGAASPRRCDTNTRACVDCITDEHCPSGTLCVGNLCVAGCSAARACPSSQQCCSGACVDAQSNTAHCGACDQRCAVANASPRCLNGACTVAACVAPFGDCDGTPGNGCEVDTSRDVAHCGGCGAPCAARPNTAASCAGGACVYACAAGFADCDGDPSNGCEVDTRTSTTHCGGCGARCSPANATAACAAGACTIGACTGGYGDCDGNVTNGCEADLPVSVSHCGACGNRCPASANAAPVCVGGACSSVCTAGFADCDSAPGTGCEVDVRVDGNHCGSCGRRCSSVGGTSTCATGACTVRCDAGRGDCDGNALTGCEVDLRASSAHCGACGVACDANAACAVVGGAPGCACNPGYTGSGLACADVDECLAGNGGCDANATCINTVGGRTCTCNTAFTGNGLTCAPVVIELTIAASTTGYNVFLQAGAPMIPRVVQVTVNPGVVVSSTSPAAPAFVSGALRPGSELRIVNRGTIVGAGGAGGAGGGYGNGSPNPQSPGAPGGAAISTSVRLVIDNTSGNVWGGGGGGGGGAVATIVNVLGGGGGGGGGAGTIVGAGGAAGPAFSGAQYPVGVAGQPGTATTGGAGGAGGNSGTYPNQFAGGRGIGGTGGAGGALGQPGARGGDGNLGGTGMAGGAAGPAVALNGSTVTWTGGDNTTQVRGPVN
jgi:hypothetical protein